MTVHFCCLEAKAGTVQQIHRKASCIWSCAGASVSFCPSNWAALIQTASEIKKFIAWNIICNTSLEQMVKMLSVMHIFLPLPWKVHIQVVKFCLAQCLVLTC